MKDLVDKLEFVRTQILARYSVGDLNAEWYVFPPPYSRAETNELPILSCRAVSLVQHVVRTFILHASITRPLGEMGKLQLTTDMTELEFALSAFMVLGDDTPSTPVTPSAGGPQRKQSNRNSVRRPVAKLESIGSDYWALRGLRFVLSFFRQ